MEENWVPIPGWVPYQANDSGQIRNGSTCTILRPQTAYTGYDRVKLSKDRRSFTFPVHRLVALAFHPNPANKPTVNHRNHDKHDNSATNLEWATATEQSRDRVHRHPSLLRLSRRPVWKCDVASGTRLKKYDSVRNAAKDVKGCFKAAGSICSATGGKKHNGYVQPTAFGFKWEYEESPDCLPGEIWKEVPSDLVEGVRDYMVSSHGRIRNHLGRISKAYGAAGSYPSFSFRTRQRKAHVIVARVFLPNPDAKPYVNHLNGDKEDCRLVNLEWCTSAENAQHAHDIGLNTSGRKVRQLSRGCIVATFASTKGASRITGIPQPSIWAAASGRLHHAAGFQWQFL